MSIKKKICKTKYSIKTSLAKRIKLTGTSRIVSGVRMRGHKLLNRTSNRPRTRMVSEQEFRVIKKMLFNGGR